MAHDPTIADMLAEAKPGNASTMEALLPLVYEQLRALAASYLARQPGHTLQPTALVHEAFLKMVGGHGNRAWSGRDHFMAVAATAMRQVLVDHSRRKTAEKRGGGGGGGGGHRVDLTLCDPGVCDKPGRELRVIELDALLAELARSSERAAQVGEMRLFGGMEMEQIARVLDVSRMTVQRDWDLARAWLAGKMSEPRDA